MNRVRAGERAFLHLGTRTAEAFKVDELLQQIKLAIVEDTALQLQYGYDPLPLLRRVDQLFAEHGIEGRKHDEQILDIEDRARVDQVEELL
jgi:hypothetical protein